MAKPAIKPDFYQNIPSLANDEEAEKRGITDEERFLSGMSQTAGWPIFENFAHELMDELDELNDMAIANHASMEEIGKNTMIISLTKGIIKRMLNKVTDCKEACETSGGK